jgi:hypothetical protein
MDAVIFLRAFSPRKPVNLSSFCYESSPHAHPLSHLTLALSYEEREKEVSFYWRGVSVRASLRANQLLLDFDSEYC